MPVHHAWIREVREDITRYGLLYNSYHRVGCMAAEKIGKDKYKIAFSLAAPSDKCDLKHAKRLATRRLKFKTKSKIVSLKDAIEKGWENVLGLENVVYKHFKEGRFYPCSTNDNALLGLLSN